MDFNGTLTLLSDGTHSFRLTVTVAPGELDAEAAALAPQFPAAAGLSGLELESAYLSGKKQVPKLGKVAFDATLDVTEHG